LFCLTGIAIFYSARVSDKVAHQKMPFSESIGISAFPKTKQLVRQMYWPIFPSTEEKTRHIRGSIVNSEQVYQTLAVIE